MDNTIGKIPLNGLSSEEMAGAFASLGLEKFRTSQVWQWMYQRGLREFESMSNVGKAARVLLSEHFSLDRPTIEREEISKDGTRKWLFRFSDGNKAETVYIPEEDRATLCISSQVGCTLTCTFCHTGTQKLVRNLTAGEIVGQIMAAKDALTDWSNGTGERKITNIVLMGMGEPLFNYDNVAKAMRIVMDGAGISLSRKRITLSTSGHVPLIRQAADELGINLAISLHAVQDDLRDVLVPLNKRWKIAELLDACRYHASKHTSQRVTFEYVMLDGVNDSDADAKRLVQLIRGIPAKINLIPFNPWPGTIYTCSTSTRIKQFASIVQNAGYASPVRTPRGQDILAACGQLKSDSEKTARSFL